MKYNRRHSLFFPIALALTLFSVTACAPVALTAAGVAGGAATGHHLGGIAYRTFTEPLPRVRSAVYTALKRMAIKPGATQKTKIGEEIKTTAGERTIEIEMEALTPNTTRVRSVVKVDGGMGIVVDSATAVEIITQIEQALGKR